ncbi:MAG: UvrD-helicase domain-containing protein [Proteobacteria bacterium]|nr:UvrD-helicase domain-containing protein [Pseudomonadota bacterium]MDA1331510.1 UvrD-helicase domain-containing protein [Pseudomonadota bacterium]
MSEILHGLNEPQIEATTHSSSSILVLAGAGSGKTRVLTTRIVWLIQTGQINPFELLAVTFTNKAAKEMLLRITAMLPINTRGMWIGTFHGLCNRLLRSHHREANLPQTFQILDSADQLSLIKRVMKSLSIDENRYPFRQAQYFINTNKEEGSRPDKAESVDEFSRTLIDIYREYDRACAHEGVVDFSELLLRSYELLTKNERLLQHYQNRFKHILVDEFQDTNKLQYVWLKLLANGGACVMAVGDDDQSIYAFRGAHSRNMLSFETDFSIQKVVKLEQNYRSHGNILDGANALIKNNSQRLGKNLWTDQGEGEPIRVFRAMTDGEEASFIIEEVQALRNSGLNLKNIALLYRSNAQSRVLEHGLFSTGLPYKVYGGLRFFERKEVKHALAYLRLIANQNDDGAFLRIINFPTRGIGNRTIEQIRDIAERNGTSLWQASCLAPPSGRAFSAVSTFITLIEKIKTKTVGFLLPELIEHINETSGLIKHYQKERDGQDRNENLNELVNAATAFIADRTDTHYTEPRIDGFDDGDLSPAEIDPLVDFLAHASLEAGDNQASVGEDALQLMTVHAAKGLEFHTVFISGLEEGLFPHENSINEHGGLEEERRLMYVAMTRAMRRLYLSHSQMRMLHGQTRYNIESRFIDEIPEELLKKINHTKTHQQTPPSNSFTPNIRKQEITETLRIGQQVRHAKFGVGIIVQTEGQGGDARLQVNFRASGLKWLALEYAKLATV